MFSLENEPRDETREIRRRFEGQREVEVEGEEGRIEIGSNRQEFKRKPSDRRKRVGVVQFRKQAKKRPAECQKTPARAQLARLM